ncbi:MAG: hypothetical protein GXY55_16880 [Phycisphaerae bacterium]|nr:hypothetical protein [Phycisphaerae bacterium]
MGEDRYIKTAMLALFAVGGVALFRRRETLGRGGEVACQFLVSLLFMLLLATSSLDAAILDDGGEHVINTAVTGHLVIDNSDAAAPTAAELITGGSVGQNLSVYGNSILYMRGGDVRGDLNSGYYLGPDWSRARVHISGGTVGGSIHTWRGDHVVMSGGSASAVDVKGPSMVAITGGTVHGIVRCWQQSQLALSGGTLERAFGVGGTSVATVSGGTVQEGLWTWGESNMTVTGGDIRGDIRSGGDGGDSNSTIILVGSGFAIDGVPTGYGIYYASDCAEDYLGRLTGQLAGGEYLHNDVFIRSGSRVVLKPAPAANTAWDVSTGHVLQASNWSDGLPDSNRNALINGGQSAFMSGGVFSVSSITIGDSTSGAVSQSDGLTVVSNVFLVGGSAGSNGTYTLNGAGELVALAGKIGVAGKGFVSQSSGLVTIHDQLHVAAQVGSEGGYSLSGSGRLMSLRLYVGNGGTGQFTQTGGSNIVRDQFRVGNLQGSYGTYELSGSSELSTMRTYVGYSGTGLLVHTDGRHQATDRLVLGQDEQASGRYELGGNAVLESRWQYVGHGGTGAILQDGGSNVAQYIRLASMSAGTGAYSLSGGRLAAGTLYIGYSGEGEYSQSGGMSEIDVMRVGFNAGSDGRATVAGGSLTVGTLRVGDGAAGELQVASSNAQIIITNLLHFGGCSVFSAVADSEIRMSGSIFENLNIDPNALTGLANTTLIFEGDAVISTFEVGGLDDVANTDFTIGTLQVGGVVGIGRLQLVDLFDNQPDWTGREALHVGKLIIGQESHLDLNGINLYCMELIDRGV